MRDPQLTSDRFARDRVISKETIPLKMIDPSMEGASSGGAFHFSADRKLVITAKPMNPELSQFDTLCLDVRNVSREVMLVGIKLFQGSGDTSGTTFLSGGRETLAPAAAQRLRFPIECFGRYGTSEDWEDVRGIEFTFAREKDYPGIEQVEVEFYGLKGESRQIPSGPRLTMEGLSQVLSSEGLEEPVNDKALSVYSISNSAIFIPPPHLYPKESADEILGGKIMGQRVGMPIDWRSNPLGSLEWTHFLHRHHFLRPLVVAAAETREAKYPQALGSIITGWIQTNPVPMDSNGGAGPAWETLSVAWRLREWLWVAGACKVFGEGCGEDLFTKRSSRHSPAFFPLLLRSIWEHARSLMDHQGHPNNWIIVESAALALAGLCFCGFRESSQWVETGIQRLESEFKRQFFVDGVHFEISPLYHGICFHAFLEVKEVADAVGFRLPEIFYRDVERCTNYLQALCRPDFTWPSLNDSGSSDMDYTALMRKAGEAFENPEAIWIGSRGKNGKPAAAGLRVFPDAGIAAMRSEWKPDANFVIFRAGPAGASHVHEDMLSLDVTALGVPCLVDPGITTYGPGILTDHYREPAAHNTILVDDGGTGCSTLSFAERIRPASSDFWHQAGNGFVAVTGIACRCRAGVERNGPIPPFDSSSKIPPNPPLRNGGNTAEYSESDKTSDKGCKAVRREEKYSVTRTVVFVDSRYWVIRDFVSGHGEHHVRAYWQFAPGHCETDPSSLALRYSDCRGSGLALIPCFANRRPALRCLTGSLEPVAGWVSVRGGDVPAPSCEYDIRTRLPMTLLWLLWPSAGNANPPTVERRDVNENDLILEVSFEDGSRDELEIAHEKAIVTRRTVPRL